MPVTSTTLSGVNVFQFSGVVTDAQIQTAWSGTVINGVYVLNRAIYLDNTADISGVTGGFLVDFGTQVLPAIILHTNRDKSKSTFRNFTFLQRLGLTVPQRTSFIQLWNGSSFGQTGGGISNDGLSQIGGGFIYGVSGNPGGADPRYLNEIAFTSLEGVTIYSQEFAEQELQPCLGGSAILRGLTFEKCFGFPQLGTAGATGTNVVVYRSNQNTQHPFQQPIRLFAQGTKYVSICYVDSYVTRNNTDITSNLIVSVGTNALNPATCMILNNYTRESWFGASKTSLSVVGFAAENEVIGGVLKKLQFLNGGGGVVRCYDSRSTTLAQKSKFTEILLGNKDFLDPNNAPVTDANGRIAIVHVGAFATGTTANITRYSNHKYTFQKFGYQVIVGIPDMTTGDNDLSAYTPISLSVQEGISRTQSAINASTSISSFQELLEELHVLAIGLVGASSYNAYNNGNLFQLTGTELGTAFSVVNIDPNATSKIAYNPATNTLTIKASNLVSNSIVDAWNNATGVVNLLNGATIQGVYQDSTGTSTVLTILGFGPNSAVYVEDNNEVQKFYNSNVSGEVVLYLPPTATGSWYYAVEKYGNQRQSDFFTFSGGQKAIVVKELPDNRLLLTKVQAQALTVISNPDTAYDAMAVLRETIPYISFGQILSKDGSTLYGFDYEIVINASATKVVDADYDSKLITLKSSLLQSGPVCNLIKVDLPKTVTANTNEVITVNIEDANGDSTVKIDGVSGSLVDVWKCVNGTINSDFSTGTKIASNIGEGNFRFIGQSGFKLIFHDKNTQITRDCSMSKGTYSLGWFVFDSAQGGLNQTQAAQFETMVNQVEVIGTPLQAEDYTAPDNAIIALIQTKVDALENYDDTDLASKVDALENYDDTSLISKVDAIGTPLQADDYIEPDNATIAQIKTKVDTLNNSDFTETNSLIVELGTPLQAVDYEAPNNEGITYVKTKVEQLENYNDGTLQDKVDAIKTKIDQLENFDGSALVNKVDAITPKLVQMNEGLQLLSNFEPYEADLPQ
jgi:hypothetical protein